MPIAFNPETNSAVFLGPDGGWQPAPVARNDAGESIAFDGQTWVPLKMPTPKPSMGLGEAISQQAENPDKGPVSFLGLGKAIIEGAKVPNMALGGQFNPENATPGTLTEEDVFRRDVAKKAEAQQGFKMGGAVMTGAAPSGLLGAPRGSIGMGFSRPGGPPTGAPILPTTPPPIPPAAQVIEKAAAQDIPIPRYMVDEGRATQGFAAGLQNIPGAGDKIAKAADVTQKAIGSAADRVTQGFGTGSPAVAGSYAKDALTEWITTGSQKTANRVYDAVDNMVNPAVTTPLKSTAQVAQTILDRRMNAGIPGRSAAVDTVLEGVTNPNGLNYHGLKDLRSFLGEMTPDQLVSQGLRPAEVKQLYGAMTQDLRSAVLNGGGPKALNAFNKANTIYDQIVARREALSKIIGVKGDAAPEAVFSRLSAMAGSKSSADASRLMQARKAMGPEAWNEVASASVARLGRDPQGEFSIKRFLTAYGNMSQSGRSALFSTTGRDNLGRALEDINFITKHIEEKLLQFYNPSGTAKSLASTGTVLGMLHSPIQTLSTIVGGNRLATILSEPASARAVADWTRAYRDAIVAPHAGSSRAVRAAANKLAAIVAPTSAMSQQDLANALWLGVGPASPMAGSVNPNLR